MREGGTDWGRGGSICKGPVVTGSIAYLKMWKKVNVAGATFIFTLPKAILSHKVKYGIGKFQNSYFIENTGRKMFYLGTRTHYDLFPIPTPSHLLNTFNLLISCCPHHGLQSL